MFSLFVLAFLLMPAVILAQQKLYLLEKMPEIYKAPVTVAVGKINPSLYKVTGDLTVQSFTVSPSTINTGDVVMSVIRWVSVSGGTLKVRLPYPGGAVDSTIINAIAGTVYETRFWHSVFVVGIHTLTVSVIKGSETATATATLVVNGPVNHLPTLTLNPGGPYTVAENSTLSVSLIGSDPDIGDALTYSLSASPFMTGATLNPTTGAFSWTPGYGTAGTYNVTFRVTDNHGATATVNTTITVVRFNLPPVIDSFSGTTSLTVGQTESYSAVTYDPDGKYLVNTIEWFDGTPNYTSVQNGTINGQVFTDAVSHTFNTPGTYPVRLTTTDANGASVYSILNVVVNPVINYSPVWTRVPYNMNILIGTVATLDYAATDADNDQLIFGASIVQGNGSIYLAPNPGPNTWRLIFTPSAVGVTDIQASVSDQRGGQIWHNVTITVLPNNQPPIITLFDIPSTVVAGTKFNTIIKGRDPDGKSLVISLGIWHVSSGGATSSLVVGAANNEELTKVFTDLILFDPGMYTAVATITDINGATDTRSYNFNVVPANKKPIFEFVGYKGKVYIGGSQDIDLIVCDDNNSLTFKVKYFMLPNTLVAALPDVVQNITPNISNSVKFAPYYPPQTGSYRCELYMTDGQLFEITEFTFVVETVTRVEEFGVPSNYSLSRNYPNPFNPTTTIKFGLPVSDYVSLIVYDLLGREVATLVNENKPAGYHTVEFNAGNLPSGVYLYKLSAGKFSKTEKMILMK